jgi:transcriptional regulator with XRE-family HTH domain
MFNSVELVREICRERKIPVSKLEQDCGFSNGYLNPKKLTKIPYDRALIIAEYLGVSADWILIGKESEKAPAETGKRDILDDVDVAFYGEFRELDDSDKETVRDMVRIMRERRLRKQEK